MAALITVPLPDTYGDCNGGNRLLKSSQRLRGQALERQQHRDGVRTGNGEVPGGAARSQTTYPSETDVYH